MICQGDEINSTLAANGDYTLLVNFVKSKCPL